MSSTFAAATTSRAAGDRPSAGNSIRRRLVRHYLPLALASTAALVVLMNVSFLDANRYPPPDDIFTEGATGAFPDGDYPPEIPTDRSRHDGTTSPRQPGGEPQPGATGGHTGPPAGGHGATQGGTPTTQPSAERSGGAAADDQHAGDRESVLRMRRYSTATGYIATVLLALTLLVGPAYLLLHRRTPISSYLRRDIGIWTAIASVIHIVFGFLVRHGDGEPLGYFLQAGDRSQILTNSFGLANWAGLAAVLIVAGLAAISSDIALRKLRARRWKQLQRFNYALFALVVLHAVWYGALWRTTSPYTVLLGITVVAVVVAQAVGVRLWRQRSARTATA